MDNKPDKQPTSKGIGFKISEESETGTREATPFVKVEDLKKIQEQFDKLKVESKELKDKYAKLEEKHQKIAKESADIKSKNNAISWVVTVAFMAFMVIFYTITYDYFQERRSEVQNNYSTLSDFVEKESQNTLEIQSIKNENDTQKQLTDLKNCLAQGGYQRCLK